MLTTKERSILKGLCNQLKPIINIGKQGLTEGILEEIETALYHNELIKVNILKNCQDSARELMVQVCEEVEACEPIWHLGGKFAVYKRSKKEDIEHLLK